MINVTNTLVKILVTLEMIPERLHHPESVINAEILSE